PRSAALEASGVAVAVGRRVLIEDVSLAAWPGELVGLMGPSGAGKTTLLNALNGYARPTRGAVLLGGCDLYRHFARFRSWIGYVPQDDVLHRELTVRQALYFSGRLRLPPDHAPADVRGRVADVVARLGLAGAGGGAVGPPRRPGGEG